MVEKCDRFRADPFAAYLLGSIPLRTASRKLFGGGDVRKAGSGNTARPTWPVSWDRWRGFLRWHSTLRRVRPLSGSLGASLAKAPRG